MIFKSILVAGIIGVLSSQSIPQKAIDTNLCQINSIQTFKQSTDNYLVIVNFTCNEPYRIVLQDRFSYQVKDNLEFSDYGTLGKSRISWFFVSTSKAEWNAISILPLKNQ